MAVPNVTVAELTKNYQPNINVSIDKNFSQAFC